MWFQKIQKKFRTECSVFKLSVSNETCLLGKWRWGGVYFDPISGLKPLGIKEKRRLKMWLSFSANTMVQLGLGLHLLRTLIYKTRSEDCESSFETSNAVPFCFFYLCLYSVILSLFFWKEVIKLSLFRWNQPPSMCVVLPLPTLHKYSLIRLIRYTKQKK